MLFTRALQEVNFRYELRPEHLHGQASIISEDIDMSMWMYR